MVSTRSGKSEFFRGSGKRREIRDYLEKLSEKSGKKICTHAIF